MEKPRLCVIGDYIWAKLSRYSAYWPAKVVGIHKQKLFVYFYSLDYYDYVRFEDISFYEKICANTMGAEPGPLGKAVSLINKSIEKSEARSDDDSWKEVSSSNSEEEDMPLEEIFVSLKKNKPKQRIVRGNSYEDITAKEMSSSEEEDMPLDILMKVKSSKKITSVKINDKAALKKLIPKELTVSLI